MAATAPKTAYLTVCAPPRCSESEETLVLLRERSLLPVVTLPTGRATAPYESQSAIRHAMKLQYVRDYLTSPAGRAWNRVVVADAVDVIPSSATAESIERAFQQLAAGDDALVVSAEPACWIGAACSDAVVAALRRAAVTPTRDARQRPTQIFLKSWLEGWVAQIRKFLRLF